VDANWILEERAKVNTKGSDKLSSLALLTWIEFLHQRHSKCARPGAINKDYRGRTSRKLRNILGNWWSS
jgi:hypothetical protein